MNTNMLRRSCVRVAPVVALLATAGVAASVHADAATTVTSTSTIAAFPPVIRDLGTGALGLGSQWVLGNADLGAAGGGLQTMQWGKTTAYGNRSQKQITGIKDSNGNYNAVIGGQIFGLTPGATYHYTVIITTRHGETRLPDRTFVATAPPKINALGTGELSGVRGGQWFVGNVDLFGDATAEQTVRYGPTTGYGKGFTKTITGTKGTNGVYNAVIGQQIFGLTPGATYHYSVTIKTSYGATTSPDRTFVAR